MTRSWLRQSALALGAASGLLLASTVTPASAQIVPRPRPDLRVCPPTGACRWYPGRMVIQANALGRSPNIVANNRGMLWPSSSGVVSLAVPQPHDYRGGRVRVGVFYYIGGDDEGTVGMNLTPVGLRPGRPFELYGGVLTSLVPAQSDTHYEQWAVLPTVNTGFSGEHPWWHVQIGRQGTFDGRLYLLAVLVEYD